MSSWYERVNKIQIIVKYIKYIIGLRNEYQCYMSIRKIFTRNIALAGKFLLHYITSVLFELIPWFGLVSVHLYIVDSVHCCAIICCGYLLALVFKLVEFQVIQMLDGPCNFCSAPELHHG